ncbi:MAG TPA: hypothetical protein VL966_04975 [Alphaproteobacteria bacterium]|jgi:hypothetical protein|nr:hypothetical protein [Alphaproteobacteria bacterium]
MADPGELPGRDDLMLSEAGLRLRADESGTSIEFVCHDGRSVQIRINDFGERLNRHEAEILRVWSAEQQARRRL